MKTIARISIVCLMLAFLLSQFVITGAQESVTATFQDFGIDEIRLVGLGSFATATFLYQSNWLIENNIVVDLNYSTSPILNSQLSLVTVFARAGDDDWTEVTSFRPIIDGDIHTVTFGIPRSQIVPDAGVLELAFEANLPVDGLECGPVNNHSQWMLIHGDSRITLLPVLDTTPPTLADLEEAIFVQNSITGPTPVAVVLPDKPDSVTLTAAANVMARLGTGAGKEHFPFEVYTASSLPEEVQRTANLVVVGTIVKNTLIDDLLEFLPASVRAYHFFDEAGQPIPGKHGVVQIFNSPWNEANHILLVAASTPDGLRIASEAFADANTVAVMNGNYEVIEALAPEPVSALNRPWSQPTTTFAQFGFPDRIFEGVALNNIAFTVQRPPGLELQAGKLALHMAFSKNLVDSGIYFDIYANNVFLGTIDTTGVTRDLWAEFDLPVSVLNQTADGKRPRSWRFTIQLTSSLPSADGCDQSFNSWLRIYSDSYFTTRDIPGQLPDLQLFPYPFVSLQQEEAAPVTIVVPDNPTSAELQVAFGAAATIGFFSQDNFDLALITSMEFSENKYRNAHLIIIGTAARQPLIDEITESKFYEIGSGVYQSQDENRVGFIHQVTSPWNEQRYILLLYANSEAGLTEAGKALYLGNPIVDQPGSVVLVRAASDQEGDGENTPIVIYRELPFDIAPQETLPAPVTPATSTPATPEATPEATTTPTIEATQTSEFVPPATLTPSSTPEGTESAANFTGTPVPMATTQPALRPAVNPGADASSAKDDSLIPVAIIGFLLATTLVAGGYTWFRA